MVTKKSYRLLLFNSWVWTQTVILFVYSKITSYLRSFFLRSEDPCNPRWIQSILEIKFTHLPSIAEIQKIPMILNGGRFVGHLYRIQLRYGKGDSSAGCPRSLVVKQGKEHFHARLCAKHSGSAREAIFYQSLMPKHGILSSCVPEIYYSRGNLLTGEYMIVMEDLKGEAVPAAHLLGNQCCIEVPVPMEEQEKILPIEVLHPTFTKIAEIHAQFWRSKTLLKNDWLKGVPWRKGRGKLSWELAMCSMRTRWTRVCESRAFTPLLKETIESVFEGTSWSRWQILNDVESPDTPFTLVHGDFHGNNTLFMIKKREPRTIFVDWSDVGVGCPFTDLANFMIGNATIEFRREHERQLFDGYHSRLIELGVDPLRYPHAKCWERYKSGGLERWLQILILFVSGNLPESPLLQFSRQVESFLQDHSSSVPECFHTIFVSPL